MVTKTGDIFTTVTIEGALLPPDILQRAMDADSDIGGVSSESYHLYGERLNEATNRAWNRLQGAWQAFKQAQARLADDDIGTTITRERWLLVLFNALDYGRLDTATAIELDGRSYAISHRYKDVPIHLLSYKVALDKRTAGVAGAATGSPHSMLQVFLNRMDEHLWGILSNGYQLRILRDNLSLTRQAYIEFDLEAMMEGEVYSDFVLLYLLCHQSRVEQEKHSDYWLEKWRKAAEKQGKRALEDLRGGVEKAINCLGIGFLSHPHNMDLRDALADGSLDKQDYYRELLRLVYRMLFLFVAEDRNLLQKSEATEKQRDLYQHYSTNRLRDISANLRGTAHHDLYESLRLIMQLLGGEREGAEHLGLPVLGSFLFNDSAMHHIIGAKIANRDLLEAVRAISTIEDKEIRRLRRVDFKNLGSEELGSVYESLLELHPDINLQARTFSLAMAGGNERKTTGSYYTPSSLINALLDSALDPVLDETIKAGGTRAQIEENILDLKICDPACGSGHFLIAAANRMAKRLASVRTGEDEPTPEDVATAKRDVIGHCIYGVDINPMAVELCKVNLWMEALDPGKPLTFLDHRIQVGNSLLGTTPRLMREGIPDDAFKAIEGDDKKYVASMKKVNKTERKQRKADGFQRGLWDDSPPVADYAYLTQAMQNLDATPDDTLDGIRHKERQFAELANDPEYIKARLLADTWCAAFVWEKRSPKTPPSPTLPQSVKEGSPIPMPLTDRLYRQMEENPMADNLQQVRQYVVQLTERYAFFHWHVAFPDVFNVDVGTRNGASDGGEGYNEQTGWQGGFDVVLGNPPWERLAFEDKQFFTNYAPHILEVSTTAKRKQLISELQIESPSLYEFYLFEVRRSEAENNFVSNSGRFPYGSAGRTNTYALFSDLSIQLVSNAGKCGLIIPPGLALDVPMQSFWEFLVNDGLISSLISFENEEFIFPAVHHATKFALITLNGSGVEGVETVHCGFFLRRIEQINDPAYTYQLPVNILSTINPITKLPPISRTQKHLDILMHIHSNNPIFANDTDNDLARAYRAIYSAGFSQYYKDTSEFSVQDKLNISNVIENDGNTFYPLLESKLMHQFDISFATYHDVDKNDITSGRPRLMTLNEKNRMEVPVPRFWMESDVLRDFYQRKDWNYNWTIGVRDITSATNERTAIAAILPYVGLIQPLNGVIVENALVAAISLAAINSFAFDFVAKQKTPGSHFNVTIFSQMPIPSIEKLLVVQNFIVPRVLELTYTAWDLQAFAEDVGYQGAPFVWDEERRFLMRCELDALYFHLYQIERDDVDYIMETFPIVKRKDIKRTADENGENGEYVTKRVILEMYDEMANLEMMSVPAPKDEHSTYDVPDVSQWQTWLNPPPADESVAHGE